MKPAAKAVLKIGKYYHAAASDALADSPMRLAWTSRGQYYWTMVRDGEYHWWLTILPARGEPDAAAPRAPISSDIGVRSEMDEIGCFHA
jgi:hypothetical protein